MSRRLYRRFFRITSCAAGVARRDAGGGGLNVSRAIRLLGGKSLACYFAGGPSGDMLEALLEAETLLTSPSPD